MSGNGCMLIPWHLFFSIQINRYLHGYYGAETVFFYNTNLHPLNIDQYQYWKLTKYSHVLYFKYLGGVNSYILLIHTFGTELSADIVISSNLSQVYALFNIIWPKKCRNIVHTILRPLVWQNRFIGTPFSVSNIDIDRCLGCANLCCKKTLFLHHNIHANNGLYDKK